MRNKKIISSVLGAAMALTVGTVPVCADSTRSGESTGYYYNDNIEAVVFNSYEDFAEYSLEAFSVYYDGQFMKDADFLCLPSTLTDRTEDINSITITPTYCRTVFDIDGTEIVSYSYKDDYRYSYIKDCGWKKNVNGAEVYMYTDSNGQGRLYYFEENGRYYALSVGADFGEAGCFMTKVFIDEHLYEEDGKLYCINDDGEKESGWKTINGHKYYFRRSDCTAVKGKVFAIGSTAYKFTENGVCLGKFSGKVKTSDGAAYYENGKLVSE
ncbi:MAG: hypothetical protein ACI4J5_01480 [Oscillospiraceae bacterium]